MVRARSRRGTRRTPRTEVGDPHPHTRTRTRVKAGRGNSGGCARAGPRAQRRDGDSVVRSGAAHRAARSVCHAGSTDSSRAAAASGGAGLAPARATRSDDQLARSANRIRAGATARA